MHNLWAANIGYIIIEKFRVEDKYTKPIKV